MSRSGEPEDETPEPAARGEAARPGRHGHELQRPGHQRAEDGVAREVRGAPGRELRRRAEPGFAG
jgi:hypothetical protein